MQKSAATHHHLHCAVSLLLIAFLSLSTKSTANPVINEIFYHENHGTGPENSLTEWIELYNPTATGVDLSEWSFSQGINFTFPAGTILPGTSYLVIAADPPSFNSIHPGADTGGNILGPWVGRLRNSGETITLVDQAGNRIDRVRYADEGD